MEVIDAFISKYLCNDIYVSYKLCLQVEYFIPVRGLPNM